MKIIALFLITCLSILGACSHSESKKIPIAILTPVSHPSLEKIEQGFKDTIEAKHPGVYRFVTYNAQGNKTLMRGEIEEIANQHYPLVFTIGTLSSQMASEVFAKKKTDTPIVFTAVNDPTGARLVDLQSVTGVQELLDFTQELQQLLRYKPNISKVLLVVNPMEPGLSKDIQEIRSILEKNQIQLITAEVFQTNELLLKVSPLISKADAVIVLKDNTVVGGLDTLVKLCNQHHLPLMASDLDSPDRGAAFGYGVHESEFGVEGAKKALLILDDHMYPKQIPVTPVPGLILKVNKQAALLQGIPAATLDQDQP